MLFISESESNSYVPGLKGARDGEECLAQGEEHLAQEQQRLAQGKEFVMASRRALSTQVVKEEAEQQRENIFHVRCIVNDKLRNMIIGGGS